MYLYISAQGFDCCPKVFTQKGNGEIEFVHDLDVPRDEDDTKVT